jgi:hypothetical protein
MRVRLTEDAASDLHSIKDLLSDQSSVIVERVLFRS